MKVTIDEFEQKIDEFHEERKELETTMQSVQSHLEAQMRTEEILSMAASPCSSIESSVVQDSPKETMPMAAPQSPSLGSINDLNASDHADLIRNVDYGQQVTSEESSNEIFSTCTSISPQISVACESRIKVKSEVEDTCKNRLGSRVRVKSEGTKDGQSSATSRGKENSLKCCQNTPYVSGY